MNGEAVATNARAVATNARAKVSSQVSDSKFKIAQCCFVTSNQTARARD